VREALADEGIACDVRDLPFEALLEADEVFLTNSLIGLWPVARLGERRWAPGPVTRRLQAWIERDDAQDL
jgi:4-amino-4-deoxychorismate lyase